jgi:hypothetical protein
LIEIKVLSSISSCNTGHKYHFWDGGKPGDKNRWPFSEFLTITDPNMEGLEEDFWGERECGHLPEAKRPMISTEIHPFDGNQ